MSTFTVGTGSILIPALPLSLWGSSSTVKPFCIYWKLLVYPAISIFINILPSMGNSHKYGLEVMGHVVYAKALRTKVVQSEHCQIFFLK